MTIGGFGYYSGNTVDNLTTNPENGARYEDRLWRAGPDITFTLLNPLYLNLYSQILFGEDSNATGFGKKASWWGGFVQGEVKPLDELILYGRYDWIDGDRFNDTDVTINVVIGAQYFLYENFKLTAEYRRGEKDLNPARPTVFQLKKTEEDAVFAGFRLVF
jgi:hypothetical protein